jgi:hypothetical protein
MSDLGASCWVRTRMSIAEPNARSRLRSLGLSKSVRQAFPAGLHISQVRVRGVTAAFDGTRRRCDRAVETMRQSMGDPPGFSALLFEARIRLAIDQFPYADRAAS